MKAISVIFFLICIGFSISRVKIIMNCYKIYKQDYNEYCNHFVTKEIYKHSKRIFICQFFVFIACLISALGYAFLFIYLFN